MLETRTVSSCLTFDLESSRLEIELHIRSLTDLANHASEIINLMTRTRPTVGRSICLSVRSGTDCLSANQITEFCAYLCRYYFHFSRIMILRNVLKAYVIQCSLQRWRKQSIASCSRHVTRCNLRLQLTMVYNGFRTLVQSLQKVELSSTLYNRCKPKKIAREAAERTCFTLQYVSQRRCDTSCKENCSM